MYALTISSFPAFCDFQTCMPLRCPSKCDVPTLYTISFKCLRMRASLAVRESSGEDTSTASQALSVSLSGANRTFLQHLLGRWAFACLDVAYSAAVSREWSRGGRASPNHRTRSFAGTEPESRTLREVLRCRCLTKWCWRVRRVRHPGRLAPCLYDLAAEKGEHLRLDWKGEEPQSKMRDGHAAAAPIDMKLRWTTMFSHRFSNYKHVNLLELGSLIRLLRPNHA